MSSSLQDFLYIIASVLFIYGLKMLGKAESARRGNLVSAVGMLLAVFTVLLTKGINWIWLVVALIIGTAIGLLAARRVQMTQMPEMVALFNGLGGLASLLVGWIEFHDGPKGDLFSTLTIGLAIVIGGVTFSGSMIAFAKLSGRMNGKPILFKNQQLYNGGILAGLVLGIILMLLLPKGLGYLFMILLILTSLVFGVLGVIPIGGADMPIVISLLNSYSGLAASMAGFALNNNVLIVAGSLVGASGLILTQIMCKAMNRSLANVLFSGFGSGEVSSSQQSIEGEMKAISAEDAFYILEAAQRVIVVPGYGMAVAQAQHAVRELAQLLEQNGAEVNYAIHPVAGRMPGHMNVLLAEANVPYEQLVEPDDVNPTMDNVDVAIVIGANDVVNPAAREEKASPLYGMPIINVDEARNVFVLKRGKGTGFSGVENPLFYKPNTRMLYGDAKDSLTKLVSEFKEALS
ncbi:MAG: NAD(P)(+) transhydrogenase (Re/Si-specific) subunit beta [Deinococcales bacterium]